jgi:hypothetical protein
MKKKKHLSFLQSLKLFKHFNTQLIIIKKFDIIKTLQFFAIFVIFAMFDVIQMLRSFSLSLAIAVYKNEKIDIFQTLKSFRP